MKKIGLLIGLTVISLTSQAQVWSQVGNTLQRQTNGTYSNYRFNLGSLGFAYFYSKTQTDSLFNAAIIAGVTSFNGRTGAVVPLTGDYASFYPSLTGSYANPSWISSLAYSKITGVPNFIPYTDTLTKVATKNDLTEVNAINYIADTTNAYAGLINAYNATRAGGTLYIKNHIYTITSCFIIKKPITIIFENGATLKANDTSSYHFGGNVFSPGGNHAGLPNTPQYQNAVIKITADHVNIIGATLDGNMHIRSTVLNDTCSTTGIYMVNASYGNIRDITLKNMGCTDGADPLANIGSGILMYKDSSLTKNVGNNIIEHVVIPDTARRVSFGFRLLTSIVEPDSTYSYFLTNNRITNLEVSGTGKSVIEYAGHEVQNNIVENVKVKNFGGNVGFDEDYGANHNIYRDVWVQGIAQSNTNASINVFASSSTDKRFDGYTAKPNSSQYNIYDNCRLTDVYLTKNNLFLNLYGEQHGKYNQLINPKIANINITGTGNKVSGVVVFGISNKLTGFRDTCYALSVINADFANVVDAFRFTNAGYTQNLTVQGGTFNTSQYVINGVDTVNNLNVSGIKQATSVNSFFIGSKGYNTSIANSNITISAANVAIALPSSNGGYNTGATITGNHIEGLTGTGTAITTGAGTSALPGLNISNNIFNGHGLGNIALATADAGPAVIIGNINTNPVSTANASNTPSIMYGAAIPTVGTWKVGDQVINVNGAAGGIDYWRCTTAGTPGTWSPVWKDPNTTTGDIAYNSSATIKSRLGVMASPSVLIGGTVPAYSGTLPNGLTATTQTVGDNTTKVATDAFVNSAIASTAANPSATAGKTPVNGSATTLMRSDAAPPVDSTATGYQTVSNFFPKGDTRYARLSASNNFTGAINTFQQPISLPNVSNDGSQEIIFANSSGGPDFFYHNAGGFITLKTNSFQMLGSASVNGTFSVANIPTSLGGDSSIVVSSKVLKKVPPGYYAISANLIDNIKTVTANYTILSTDFAAGKKNTLDLYVDATSGNVTITMPSASTFAGYTIYITKKDSSVNTVTINTVSSGNTLLTQYQSRQYNSDTSSWYNH